MARLPDVGGERPTPRFGGVPEAPEMGGTAEATSRLGSAIAGFGEVVLQEKIKDDKYRVEDAFTRLQQSALDLSKGESGWSHKKSGDVATDGNFFEDHSKLFESASKEISDSLGNEEQKEMFARRYEVAKVGYSENIINHITKESGIYKGQVYKSGISARRDIAAADYDNPATVKIALLESEKLTETELDRLGVKGDARKMILKENKSAIHEGVIEQAVDDGNYEYAKTWFEKNQKNILGEKQDDIKKLLRVSGVKQASQEAVDEYIGKGLTEREAKAEARKIKDPDRRDATVGRITARYGEQAQELDRRQKDAGELVRSMYSESIDAGQSPEDAYDSIPQSTINSMDGAEHMALQNRVKIDSSGAKKKTDWDKWDEFEERLDAGDITDVRQVREYDLHFSDRDMRNAVKRFEKKGELSTTDLRTAFIDNLGRAKSKWTESDKEQWLTFQSYMLDKVEVTRRPEDLNVWADRWFMSGETAPTGVWTDFWTNDPDKLGEAVTEGRGEEFYLDIPDDDTNSVRSIMQSIGVSHAKDISRKQFYTQEYLPSVDYLRAHDIAINDRNLLAVSVLRQNNKQITPETIKTVTRQIK